MLALILVLLVRQSWGNGMSEFNQGLSLRHGFFIMLVLALALSSFEFSESDLPGISGQAMGVAVEVPEAPDMSAQGPSGLEIQVTTSTVSFVPLSTLGELANIIETTRSPVTRSASLKHYRSMIQFLPEGVNRSFYEAELARLEKR